MLTGDIFSAATLAAVAALALLFGRHALSSRQTIWRHVRRARRNGASQ